MNTLTIYDSRPAMPELEARLKADDVRLASISEVVLKVKHYAIRCYYSSDNKFAYKTRRDGKISGFIPSPDSFISNTPLNSDSSTSSTSTTTPTTTNEEQTMTTNTATTIQINPVNLGECTKASLTEVCKQLGLRKNWAPISKAEIVQMILSFPADAVVEAARRSNEFDDEDIALITEPLASDATETVAAAPAAVAAPVTATPTVALPPAGKQPDVSTVAALLAQLLATGKAGLDADEVRSIVEPLIHDFGGKLLCAVDAKIAAVPAREIVVKTERTEIKLDGLQHSRYEDLLRACSARQPDGHRLNVYLYGPPGTGKTTAARNVAKALDLPFHCNGAVSTKYELTGFIDANGVCHNPEFRKAWQHGGVYLFDEIDGSVSAAVVAFNAALANGVMAFPDGMIERHPDCVVIAAANTVHGATAEFTGRSKLDAASLDRFVMIEWPIDDRLEEAMAAGRADWLREVRRVRKAVAEKGIKVMVTPRATMYGASLLNSGMAFDAVKSLVLRKGMNDQQWAMVA